MGRGGRQPKPEGRPAWPPDGRAGTRGRHCPHPPGEATSLPSSQRGWASDPSLPAQSTWSPPGPRDLLAVTRSAGELRAVNHKIPRVEKAELSRDLPRSPHRSPISGGTDPHEPLPRGAPHPRQAPGTSAQKTPQNLPSFWFRSAIHFPLRFRVLHAQGLGEARPRMRYAPRVPMTRQRQTVRRGEACPPPRPRTEALRAGGALGPLI